MLLKVSGKKTGNYPKLNRYLSTSTIENQTAPMFLFPQGKHSFYTFKLIFIQQTNPKPLHYCI